MDVLQASFAGGEISPKLHGRVDLPKYSTSLASAKNCRITAEGSAENRPGLEWVGEIADASQFEARNIEFQFSNEQTYQLEFSNYTMRVIKDGALVLDGTPKVVTSVSTGAPALATASGHGFAVNDEVYLSGITSMPSLDERTFYVRSVTTNTFTLKDRYGVAVDGTGLTAFTGSGSAEKVYEIATPYPSTVVRKLKFDQSADTMWITHPGYPVQKLTRTGHAAWSITAETFASGISAPTISGVTHTGSPTNTLTQYYVVTAVSPGGEESVASAASSVTNPTPDSWPQGAHTGISCSSVSGALRYRFYKRELGVYGFIGESDGTSFADRNHVPNISQTPPTAQNPFGSATNYPSCAAFFEQRQFYAGTDAKPNAVTGSKSPAFSNFDFSRPALATDSLEFSLVSKKVNRVLSLVSLNQLIALTTDAEFVISGAGDDDFLSATNPGRPKAQSNYGAYDIEALVVGSSALFVQADGQTVRDMGYEFIRNAYDGADLSIVARHLVEGKTVVSWAYSQYPDSLVYVVFSDGSAASFSYIRESQDRAVAWAPIETDGTFEDVSVIREGTRDVPYFIVKRTVNGVDKRYVERLAERDFATIEDAFFVDSGRTYSGSAATVIYGFDHLKGKTLAALADGNVIEGLVVADNGSITLPAAAEKVHAGLPYVSEIKTLLLALLQQAGGAPGRKKNITETILKMYKSRGVKVGPTSDLLVEMKERGAPFDEAIEPITADVPVKIRAKWSKDTSVLLRQEYPLPMTLQSILADVSTEDA